MSAHIGAPGFRRPQLAVPAYSATPPDVSGASRARHPARRRALAVAAAMLSAPVLAAGALAAIGAAGTGDQAAMGSLPGAHGLRGSTVSTTSFSPQRTSHAETSRESGKNFAAHGARATAPSSSAGGKGSHAPSPGGRAHGVPVPKAPANRPPPSPKTGTTRGGTVGAPTSSPTDPSQPGAPTSSSYTGGTSTTTGSGGDGSSGTQYRSGNPGGGA